MAKRVLFIGGSPCSGKTKNHVYFARKYSVIFLWAELRGRSPLGRSRAVLIPRNVW